MFKLVGAVAVGAVATMTMATAAFGMDCTNASKDMHQPAAGAQIIVNTTTGNPDYVGKGVIQRVTNGVINPDDLSGFHGQLGLDFTDSGTATITTFLVGPNDEIPQNAQNNGSPCHGITSIDTYLSTCLAP